MAFANTMSGILATISDPFCILMTFIGVVMGLVFGSLPGLTATMGCALLIPLTYSFKPVVAFGMMLGCYVGGVSGGAISACLLNIPGTPSAICTTFDGYPMAKQGRGAEALGWAATASGIGTIISWLVLVLLSPVLASVCTSFTSAEYAMVSLFGLIIISAMSKKDFLRGIAAGAIGVILACVGTDPIWGDYRLTFGNYNLYGGIYLVPAVIGIFSIPQIIELFITNKDNPQPSVKMKDFLPHPRRLLSKLPIIARSSLIGTIVGMIPAIGGATASFFAYDTAKRSKSKEPQAFGEGNVDGVISPETANNAVCGGAMIPMLTLGIPGDPVTAILLGGLTIHGLRAGPALFSEHFDVVVGMFTTLLIATIFMMLVQTFGIKVFCKILGVPVNYLAPILGVLSLIGCYAIRNNSFDIVICLILGVLAYYMTRGGYNLSSAVLGLVLGGMFETELRLALRATSNNWAIFVTRPISLGFFLISLAVLVITVIRAFRGEKKKKGNGETIPGGESE